MLIDYSTKSSNEIYNLVAQTVIPRPIAWIMTENKDGLLNIAPFSYFIPLSSKPASLIVSIGHKSDNEQKDTLKNIRDTKKCTICIANESFLDLIKKSAQELSSNISEVEKFNIKTKKIYDDFPSIVQNTPSAFFCTLMQEIDLEHSKTIPLVLQIHKQYINDNNLEIINNKININFDPIARIGRTFAKIGKILE